MDITQRRRTAAPPRGGGRLAVVDGLRLCAALAVAMFHYTAINSVAFWGDRAPFGRLAHLTAYGWLGVELFFMISGFVISLSAWGRTAGGFARSRLIRLFPAYWAAVLLTAAVAVLVPTFGLPVNARQVVVNLTMLNEPLKVTSVDLSFWTLWAEARFYLLFGLLVWAGLSRGRVLWFGYAWLIGAVISVNSGMPVLVTVLQPAYAPYFVAGIGFFLIHRFGSDLRHWGLVGLAWALAIYSVGARVEHSARTEHRPLSVTVAMLIVTGFFLVLAVVAVGWTARIRWRWLTTAGLLTYPFYLLHQRVGGTLLQHFHFLPRYGALGAVVGVMLVVAWLSHRFLERPLAGYLHRRLAPGAVDVVRGARSGVLSGSGAAAVSGVAAVSGAGGHSEAVAIAAEEPAPGAVGAWANTVTQRTTSP
ncbi:acyltransferase [Actinoplanes sp. L3-i22]|uniref:acyltransferase family protein n=1 Tax=Actinoplanes sp. L3-i22 TaxID=2836373 RepID=UPI001C73F0A7|nr:acyltransferase [Actinoplanes sp. L3-i22]BCY07195.1 acyltransferase [Actinoplanes sp. L3-i22]